MPRSFRYTIGLVCMGVALVVAIFMPEPMIWAARAAFVGPFLVMLWQRRQYQLLRTRHVFASSLVAGIIPIGYFAAQLASAGGAWPIALSITLALPLVMAALLTVSFHHLTMGTGRMA
jgi:hypothetical protein